MHGLVTVFGGSGFIGRHTVRALTARGMRVRVACRQTGRAPEFRMLGDVGQVEVVQANLRVPSSVGRALEGAEACVNLVGVLHESGRQRFQSLHAQGARTVAEAAALRGITRLVQVSAIGADPDSRSKYARTKALGEAAAREAIAKAVVVRPSVVFGAEDDFFNRFAEMATISPVLPLPGGGQTRFQPVFVGDVAEAVATAVADPACAGKTYELGGPGVFTFRELMELVLEQTHRRRLLVPLPWPDRAVGGRAGRPRRVGAAHRAAPDLRPGGAAEDRQRREPRSCPGLRRSASRPRRWRRSFRPTSTAIAAAASSPRPRRPSPSRARLDNTPAARRKSTLRARIGVRAPAVVGVSIQKSSEETPWQCRCKPSPIGWRLRRSAC